MPSSSVTSSHVLSAALRVLAVTAVGTFLGGQYGQSVLGGVMGDFLGATICMLELAVYLALAADEARCQPAAIAWLLLVTSLPQVYGAWRDRYDKSKPEPQEC